MKRIVEAGKALANFAHRGQEKVQFYTKLNIFVTGSEPQVSDVTNPLELNLNNTFVGISVGTEAAHVHLTKQEVCAEDDDEDEVILFRSTTNEKHVDNCSLNINCSELLAPIGGAACKIAVGKENGSLSVGHDSFLPDINHVPAAPIANMTSQYLLPVHPFTLQWPLDQFEVSDPATLSVPFPCSIINGARLLATFIPFGFPKLLFHQCLTQ